MTSGISKPNFWASARTSRITFSTIARSPVKATVSTIWLSDSVAAGMPGRARYRPLRAGHGAA